jgi:hypothetical protein
MIPHFVIRSTLQCQGTRYVLRKYEGGDARLILLQVSNCVIPAWSAGIQADMDVSGRILRNLDAGNPCRHDEALHVHVL